MPISKNIINEINNLDEEDNFKKLLIDLLETEDKGNHQNNKVFLKIIDDYNETYGGNE